VASTQRARSVIGLMTLGGLCPTGPFTVVRLQPATALPRARSTRTLTTSIERGQAAAATGAHVSDWQRFPTNVYLDRRYRNWIISEELGDVRFLPEVGIVMVHRVRAEHIVRELLANPRPGGVSAPRRLSMTTRVVNQPRALLHPAVAPKPAPAVAPVRPWRIFSGWLGLGMATGVFVAALVTRLDDAALLLALSLFLWGARRILEDRPVPA
jgi:hypothetical protein